LLLLLLLLLLFAGALTSLEPKIFSLFIFYEGPSIIRVLKH
jgi:hypothetical protein